MKTIVTITITEYQALCISSRFKWFNKQVFVQSSITQWWTHRLNQIQKIYYYVMYISIME